MASGLPALAQRMAQFGNETVWQEFSPLAAREGAINLGQGFPDWPSPEFVKDAMRQAMADNANQYCRSAGLPALAQALAKRYSAYLGREVGWETEVTVGVGASETLFALMQALVDPGDEVLLISPAFDIYSAQVQMPGGVSRYVPLRPSGEPGAQRWVLDIAEFERAFSERTRVLVLNTPHNPTGKCFDADELAAMRKLGVHIIESVDDVPAKVTLDALRREDEEARSEAEAKRTHALAHGVPPGSGSSPVP